MIMWLPTLYNNVAKSLLIIIKIIPWNLRMKIIYYYVKIYSKINCTNYNTYNILYITHKYQIEYQ